MTRARCSGGFTLLELLIALALFALLGLATYRMLDTVLRVDSQTRSHDALLRETSRALEAFARDVRQVQPRPVRDRYGDDLPALTSDPADASVVEFTRAGWRNPLGQPRSQLQRVRWQHDGQTWQRLYWSVLDRAQDAQPQVQQALTQVSEVRVRFLDRGGVWRSDWPPAEGEEERRLTQLPRALELRLQHARYGELTRILRLPDGPADDQAASEDPAAAELSP